MTGSFLWMSFLFWWDVLSLAASFGNWRKQSFKNISKVQTNRLTNSQRALIHDYAPSLYVDPLSRAVLVALHAFDFVCHLVRGYYFRLVSSTLMSLQTPETCWPSTVAMGGPLLSLASGLWSQPVLAKSSISIRIIFIRLRELHQPKIDTPCVVTIIRLLSLTSCLLFLPPYS